MSTRLADQYFHLKLCLICWDFRCNLSFAFLRNISIQIRLLSTRSRDSKRIIFANP
ncbi:hypothetical protein Plhal304r1_c003g0011551 [Plasmopara halstedii]